MKFEESARGFHWRSVVLRRLIRATDSPATVSSFMRSNEVYYIVRYRPQSEWLDELGRLKAACKIWSFRLATDGHGSTRMKTSASSCEFDREGPRGMRSRVPGGPVGPRPRGQYPDRRSGESHGFPAQIRMARWQRWRVTASRVFPETA